MNSSNENGTLPEGWALATLGEIADCRLGKMLDQAKNRGDLRPYLRNVNVQWGRIDVDDIKEMRITREEAEQYAVRAGDLLVCEGGEPGRCAVWLDDREMYLQKALHRVRPRGDTSPKYLRWWLQDAAGAGRLEALATGSTIKHLPGRQLAQVTVALPPAPEQRRIAARLDAVESRRAATAAHLQSARRVIDRLRSAVLAAACSGRLTEDWREANPDAKADELRAHLLKASRAAKHRRTDDARGQGLTSEEQLERLPSTWELVRLGDILDVGTGATPLRTNRAYYDEGTIPWVTSGAVNAGTITMPTELITPLALQETSVKLFPAGTLLIAMYGEGQTRGRVAELAIETGTNQAVAAVIFPEDTAPMRAFIRLFFEDSYRRIRALSVGGVQRNLNLGIVRDTLIPLPSLEEQRAIVSRARAALATAQRLTAQIDRTALALRRASEASLAKAFRGELVPTEAALAREEASGFEVVP